MADDGRAEGDELADDELLYERYGDDVLFERVAHDELYDRFGHDARYLHDEVPHRDPNFGSRTMGSGWATPGLTNARAGVLLRSMFLWLGALAVGIILLYAVTRLLG